MMALKLAVGIPFVAICLLALILIVGLTYLLYSAKKRSTAQEKKQAALEKKKAVYAAKATSLEITNYNDFMNECLDPPTVKKSSTKERKRKKLNKRKKRSRMAKKSRKQNRK